MATDVGVPNGDSGTVAPGDPGRRTPPTTWAWDTWCCIGSPANLSIEIDGTAAGTFDQVVAANGVTLRAART